MKYASTALMTILVLACGGQRQKEATTTMATQTSAGAMTITSPAFTDQGEIPKKYGCSGESISPPLSLAGAPTEAKSLALIMTDPDAPGGTFTHWVVWNIPPTDISIGEGQRPGGMEGMNSFQKNGYGAPCPPSGSHRYIFDTYALDTSLNLATGSEREDVENAMKGHILAQGRIVGTYRR